LQEPARPVGGYAVPVDEAVSEAERQCMVDVLKVPQSGGILLSESKAFACADMRLYADKCHRVDESNRARADIYLTACERTIGDMDLLVQHYQESQSGWWYENQNTVFLVAGLLIGSAGTILVVYGVNQVGPN